MDLLEFLKMEKDLKTNEDFENIKRKLNKLKIQF